MADSRILIPLNVVDLLTILKKRPDCMIWAGGTYSQTNPIIRLDIANRDIISLQRLEELNRIYRTDRLVEIGARCTLERLLKLEDHVVPAGLKLAILSSVPAPARSLATLGGNVCIHDQILNLLPWLAIADARFEIRKQGSVRYCMARHFIEPDDFPKIDANELLCKIRIPLNRWNFQQFRRIEFQNEHQKLPFYVCNFASIHKETLDDCRMGLAFSNQKYFFFPRLDADFQGQRLPLSKKFCKSWLDRFLEQFKQGYEVDDPQLLYQITISLESLLDKLRKTD